MKKAVMIFIILIVLIPSVLADWFYNSQNIITHIDISSGIEIVPSTPNGYVESATVNMTFFPKETGTQELLKFETNPQADIKDKTLEFNWEMPEGKINFGLNTDVKTTNTITEIRKKNSFPIEELPEDMIQYTKPSETIDSDYEGIIRLASELVKGEDDLYSAVFKIADWTKNNVNYNLSTLTADVSQKASWVLQNKQGVCDELTSLFIALLRAVGIPARFVSGIAYTNSPLFPDNWGAHGWAEVYFPGYGWVPFDVTYGEFGWIDPTHIKFKDSVDSDEPSTYYQWLGRNADLKTRKLDIKASLTDKTGYIRVPLKIEASTLKKAVNFGSYNLVEATVENLNDFYYANEIHLSKPKEVNVIGDESKNILLLPKEKKKLFWIIKVNINLDSRYSYTFPLIISTLNNISSETSFVGSTREQYSSLEEIEQISKLEEEEKEKRYSGNVLLDCKSGKSEFYEYEDVKVYCNAKNTGNIFLDNADICFENKCKRISLGVSQAKNFTFDINKSNIGYREIPVALRNELVSKASLVNFKIDDIPEIEVEEIGFPVNVSYSENITVSFTLAKKSQSNPKKVYIIFAQNGIEKRWNVDEFTENKKFLLSIAGSQLCYGNNDYKINVDYYDGLKKKYNTNKEFSIKLAKANLLQRLFLSLNKFEGISYEEIAIILLSGTVVFLLVVLWLFRGSRRG